MTVHVRLQVGAEAYAVSVAHVREVAGLGEVAAVPGSRAELLGVRNLRGQVLPVVDLARLLGIARPAAPERLLVAESGGRQAGFAVDDVSVLGELPEQAEETESGLLAGAALTGGELIGIIDMPRVFAALEREAP